MGSFNSTLEIFILDLGSCWTSLKKYCILELILPPSPWPRRPLSLSHRFEPARSGTGPAHPEHPRELISPLAQKWIFEIWMFASLEIISGNKTQFIRGAGSLIPTLDF